MTKKIVKRTDANNETLYFYTHSDAVDVGEGSSMKSLTEVIDDTLHKSAQTLTNAEKTQVHANLGTESFVGDRAVRYDEAQVLGTSEKTQALTNLGLNGVDDVPTENSNNVVRSGGVKAAIDDVIDDFTNRGFMYKGIAPVSAPLGEDKTFYIAKSGDYTAYTGIGDGSFTLNGIAVLTYATTTASGAWTKNDIVLFDEEPTGGSENLVKSGGVALLTKGGNFYNNLTNINLESLELFNGSFRKGYLYSTGKSYIIPVFSLSYNNLVVTADTDNCYIGYSHDAVEHVSSTTRIANTNLLKIEQVGNGTKIFTVPSEIDGQTIEYVYIVRNSSSTIYDVSASVFSSRVQYGGINSINLSKNGEIYTTKADARNLVPDDMKFKGLELKYLIGSEWIDEYFIANEWSIEDVAWSPNFVIDNSMSLNSSKPVANRTIANELGNIVIAEGSGTSSTTATVSYIPWTNLGYTLSAGTKLNIEVEGVGDDNPVRTLRVYFNNSNVPNIYIHDSKTIITLDEDVTKIRAASTAIETSYEGNISVSINYIGTTIRKLEELIDAANKRIDKLNCSYDFDAETVINKFATDKGNKEFTNSFTFSINSYGHAHKNMIVTAYAMFVNNTDESVPTVQFKYMYGTTVIYTSTAYTIGKKDEYCKKEWRIPAFMDDTSVQVIVTIPSNVTLYISEFTNYYSDTINRNAVGYRMNAHLHFYNFNTLNAFVQSAKLGYPCAIVVPKRTSDGVWVCFHDDSLSTQLIDTNGHTPADNHPGETLTISSLTYSELQTYTYKENNFGEYLKVAKLEDFFMVCAKTGMHPMFSWHPVSSAEDMQEIKALATKFGLLPYLNIKMAFSGTSSVTYMNSAYSIFGDEIESYTGDVNVDTDVTTIISALDSTIIDKTKVRIGLEFFNSRVTVEKVQATLNAGYFAAIAWMTANPTGEQIEYWIKNGVTEFTEYNMVSYGLNW